MKLNDIVSFSCKRYGLKKFMTMFWLFSFTLMMFDIFILKYFGELYREWHPLEFNIAAHLFYHPETPARMMAYVIGSLIIGCSFLASVFICKRNYQIRIFLEYSLYFTLPIVTVCCLISFKMPTMVIPAMPIWILLAVFFKPELIFAVKKCDGIKLFFQRFDEKLPAIILVISILSLLVIYRHQMFSTQIIPNEYFRIPEQYLIGINEENGEFEYVDTTDIYNALDLIGHDKIDINSFHDWKETRTCYTVEKNNYLIEKLVSDYSFQEQFQLYDYNLLSLYDVSALPPVLFYYDDSLCIIWGDDKILNDALRWKLAGIAGISRYHILDKINRHHAFDSSKDRLKIFNQLTSFLLKNSSYEISWQLTQRAYLSHHLHYLVPAQEFLLGKPLTEISHQYGLGLTIIPSYIAKLFSSNNEIEYGTYLRVTSLLIPFGFLVFIFCCWFIFKDIHRMMIPVLLLTLNQFTFGVDSLYFSYGIFNYRVLLDMPSLCLLYMYLNGKYKNNIILLSAVSLGSMFLNFEFGLFLNISLIYTLILHVILDKSKIKIHDVALLISLILCLGFSASNFNIGQHNIAKYFYMGHFSRPLPKLMIMFFIFMFALYHGLYFYLKKNDYKFADIFIFSCVYAQTLLCYFVLSGLFNHSSLYVVRFALPLIFILDFIFFEKFKKGFLRQVGLCLFLAFLGLNIAHKGIIHIRTEGQYFKTLNRHKLYEWNLPRTNFKSTMNPAFFAEALGMIDKYIPENQKEVFMISQYAPFLAFLANKYSGFPHFDLRTYLMTQKENLLAMSSIDSAKPQYIFVDSDINTPYELDIISGDNFNKWLMLESRARVRSLNELRKIYEHIVEDYELIDGSRLVSVYKRKEQTVNDSY